MERRETHDVRGFGEEDWEVSAKLNLVTMRMGGGWAADGRRLGPLYSSTEHGVRTPTYRMYMHVRYICIYLVVRRYFKLRALIRPDRLRASAAPVGTSHQATGPT